MMSESEAKEPQGLREPHGSQKPQPRRKHWAREYAEAIAIAVLIALFLRAYVVQAFKIPSGSMLPTLLVGDYLLVNKFIYGTEIPFTDKTVLTLRKPERGDIIVFKYPKDPARDFIKRIVALGGDTVESVDKHIFVNGQPVEASYVQYTDPIVEPANPDAPGDTGKRDNFGPVKVPEGKLFVMGDNRDNSHDSRFWGFVDMADVRGKAFIIYWSWDGEGGWPRLDRIGSVIH